MLFKKYYSLFVLIALIFTACHNQPSHASADKTYFIVRHAEKQAGNDPVLTTDGNDRAGDLYRRLLKEKIGKIYVTKYKRTGLTADSIRIYQKLDSVHYVPDNDGKGFMRMQEQQQENAKKILVVGHSNTLAGIIRALGADYTNGDLDEKIYDDLFIVKIKNGKAIVTEEKYGKKSE